MVEHTRAHERIDPRAPAGKRRTFEGPLGKTVDVFIPTGTRRADALPLIIHFHGSALVPEVAVSRLERNHVLAVVNLAPGSGIYDRTFTDPAVYDSLVAGIQREASAMLGGSVSFSQITLAGFSAGHGAIRAILREPRLFACVDAVLLLDGLHTAYIPERTVLADGGRLDQSVLDGFVRYGRDALLGRKRFVITHSEIFPGTFASTTETSDFLVQALGLRRTSLLRWGPLGMQQLSEVRKGRLRILGFAGNSAPDHIDHFQAMPTFLRTLAEM
jgi:hypothetical protein